MKGLAPSTYGLQNRCTTIVLHQHKNGRCAVVVKFVYKKHEMRHILHDHKALSLILHVTSPYKYYFSADS